MTNDPRKRRPEDLFASSSDESDWSYEAKERSALGMLLSSKWLIFGLLQIILLGGFFLYTVTNELNQRLARSDSVIAELEARTAEIFDQKQQLESIIQNRANAENLTRSQMQAYEAQVTELQSQIDELSEELRKALAQVPDNSEVLEIDRQVGEGRDELGRISNSLFQVGLVFKNAGQDVQAGLQNAFYLEMGFQRRGVVIAPSSGQRPAWLAQQSTVFFYDDGSIDKANEIADVVEELLGARPRVAQGAGTGVQTEDRKNTINVHIIF